MSTPTPRLVQDDFTRAAPDCAADVEAWIQRGDVAALERASLFAPTAFKSSQLTWRLMNFKEGDEAERDRAFILAKAAFGPPKAMLEWVLSGDPFYVGRLIACARWLQAQAGQEKATYPVVAPCLAADPETLGRSLVTFLNALRDADAKLHALALSMAFKALKKHAYLKKVAFNVISELGGSTREASLGDVQLRVRQLGPVVASEEQKGRNSKFALKVLKDEAAASAHASALLRPSAAAGADAPKAPRSKSPGGKLEEAPGFVTLFADAVLDPKGTLDGKGGPLGWFDHDNWETVSGPPSTALSQLSYAASFVDAALEKVRALPLPETVHIDALFDYAFTGPPGQRPWGWVIGSIPFARPSPISPQ